MPRDKRQKRDLHALSEEGMVLCNPRDKEAALRGQTEGIATDDWALVTCANAYRCSISETRLERISTDKAEVVENDSHGEINSFDAENC